jgi:hypothetical protein
MDISELERFNWGSGDVLAETDPPLDPSFLMGPLTERSDAGARGVLLLSSNQCNNVTDFKFDCLIDSFLHRFALNLFD